MHVLTISNLFHAIAKLEHAITQAAGLDVMTEEDAQALLTMVNLCTRAAHVPLELRNALAKPASPHTVKLGDGEAEFMDETMGYKAPSLYEATKTVTPGQGEAP